MPSIARAAPLATPFVTPFAAPLAALIAALLLAGGAALSSPAAGALDPGADARVAVHVVSHGWHTGIVIPIDRETVELCPPLDDFGAYRFVELGWGDEGFYRSDSISVATTVRAIGWPTPSVIHVAGLTRPPELEFPDRDLVRIGLSREEYRALVREIARAFAERDPLAIGVREASYFYRAAEEYWFLNTCNVWTLRTLRAAGVPTWPAVGIRSEVAMAQLARHGTPVRLAPREPKWPYGLGALAGAALALRRRRRRARLDPPPARDRGLGLAWLGFLAAALATLFSVVLSANGHDWARLGSRVGVLGIVAALGAVAVIALARLRARPRLREAASALLALLGCASVLSPL